MRVILKSPGLKAKVIQLNTQNQLFDQGIDAEGKKLQSGSRSAQVNGTVYAEMTMILKEQKGQPTDRVTLKDTGDFYRSFNVRQQGNDLVITAKTMKQDNDLLEVWGEDILGLTDENLQIIIDMAREAIIDYIYKTIAA